jgi:hypothetical protein
VSQSRCLFLDLGMLQEGARCESFALPLAITSTSLLVDDRSSSASHVPLAMHTKHRQHDQQKQLNLRRLGL